MGFCIIGALLGIVALVTHYINDRFLKSEIVVRSPKRLLSVSELISQRIRVRFQIRNRVLAGDGFAVHLVKLLSQHSVRMHLCHQIISQRNRFCRLGFQLFGQLCIFFFLRFEPFGGLLHHLRHLVFGVLLDVDALHRSALLGKLDP